MPTHESNRSAYATRIVRTLRASWDARPVAGHTLLQWAAQLNGDGWADVAEQAGEERFPSPETRLEILRLLALGDVVDVLAEPALRVMR